MGRASRIGFAIAMVIALAAGIPATASDTVLRTVAQVRALDRSSASAHVPVEIRGVITYNQPDDQIVFVQDATGGIYIDVSHPLRNLRKGQRVVVKGTTSTSFRTDLKAETIQAEGETALPAPTPTSFANLIAGRNDCDYVSITGRVQAATLQTMPGAGPFLLLEVAMDGGTIEAHVRTPENLKADDLLDAQVALTGVAGGIFDAKYEMLGVKLYVERASDVRILRRSPASPLSLPVTPMERVIEGFSSQERSARVRVRGAVTLYHPGGDLILQQDDKAILIRTHQSSPLQLGQVVDVVGFPDNNGYAPSLRHAQFFPTAEREVLEPQPVSFSNAVTGLYSYNLVSITGTLVDEVHETLQDTLVLESDGYILTAQLRHAANGAALPGLHMGSRLRITGDCFVQSEGIWNTAVSFSIQMRAPGDVAIVSLPSWWTVEHLIILSSVLAIVIVGVLTWAASLRRRVALQTSIIRRAVEDEATRERRRAALEKERALVLEAINSAQPLASVLELIATLVEQQIPGIQCAFRLAEHSISPRERRSLRAVGSDHIPVTEPAEDLETLAYSVERKIWSSTGIYLGSMFLTYPDSWQASEHSDEIVDMSYRLAALAVDNRRLYENLIHRSEYDQLTDVPNRFLLETRLEQAVADARRLNQHLAVVYIDLDRFKSVNDRYGHRVGDLYLQQVARRLASKLRTQDLLARIGGDEFLCLIPNIANRDEAEYIAERLACSFEHPFTIDQIQITGSASIGIAVFPEDGENGDELKRLADDAMYLHKQAGHAIERGFPNQLHTEI